MGLYDTHAHLNDPLLWENRSDYVQRAKDNGVTAINNVGYDFESSLRAVEIAKEFPECYAIIGIHPHDADQWNPETEQVFRELLDHKEENKIVAIGEIGFDLHFDDRFPNEIQKDCFKAQMELAKEYSLPVSIHSRDAFELTKEALEELKLAGNLLAVNIGVIHCYDYGLEELDYFDSLGFCFGFDGPLTFKNGQAKREVAQALPIEKILLETDCPYMAPEPYRGETNHPALVLEIAKKLAEVKEISFEEASEISENNAKRIFKI